MRNILIYAIAESACAISLLGSLWLAANDKWMWWIFLLFALANVVTKVPK